MVAAGREWVVDGFGMFLSRDSRYGIAVRVYISGVEIEGKGRVVYAV